MRIKQFIVNTLKKILPIPANSSVELFNDLDQKLNTILEQQQRLFEQNTELFQKIMDLEEQIGINDAGTEDKARSIYEVLEKSREKMEKAFIQLEKTNESLDSIQHGDLFRRIEFLQGKLIFLENLVQRNFISQYDQKNNTIYAFMVRIKKLFQMMRLKEAVSFCRVGRANDGGYVMLDDFEGKQIAYSFGIADDVSWDLDMAKRGLDIYMYDHTISQLPEMHPKFHYFQIGLGNENELDDPHKKTLAQLMKENKHMDEYGMVLKIDIEGAEWGFLQTVDEEILQHFSQIVFEFHDVIVPENESNIQKALKKLNRTHQLVHVHANNYGSYLLLGGTMLPELIEATYVLRTEHEFCSIDENECILPSKYDETNCTYFADIFLGAWNI